ncbi:MAG: [Fe-Fe] hydrogenase large subunit C-terminal domain-containing protein [Collinsella sp.]
MAHVHELLPGLGTREGAPEFVDSLSTSKSPQQMFGAIAKTYYAKVLGVGPSACSWCP